MIEIVAALALMAGVLGVALNTRARLLEQASTADQRRQAVALLAEVVPAEASPATPRPLPITDGFEVEIVDRLDPALDGLGLKVRRYSVYRAEAPAEEALAWVELFVANPPAAPTLSEGEL